MNRTTKIFCSSLLFLLLMMGAKAQTIMGGNVTVSDLAVSRSEDKLFVSMDIDVSALSVKSNREVILTPRLSGEGNELNLPSVMIAGRNRYYHHLRNGLCTDAAAHGEIVVAAELRQEFRLRTRRHLDVVHIKL